MDRPCTAQRAGSSSCSCSCWGPAWGAVLGLWAGSTGTASDFTPGWLAPPTDLGYANGVLRWTPTETTWATGTRVYRSSSSVGPDALVRELEGRSLDEFQDDMEGTTYYEVRAYYDGLGANWTSPASNRVTATVEPRLQLTTSTAPPGRDARGLPRWLPEGRHHPAPLGLDHGHRALTGTVGGAALPATLTISGDLAVTVTMPLDATAGSHSVVFAASHLDTARAGWRHLRRLLASGATRTRR